MRIIAEKQVWWAQPAAWFHTTAQKITTYKRIFLLLLLPLSMLLTRVAQAFPTAVDRFFSRGVYRGIRAVFARIFSLAPFSIAEVLLLLACLALPVGGVLWIRWFRRLSTGKGDALLRSFATMLAVVGVGYSVFVLFCGLNYYRQEFAIHSGLAVRNSSTQELEVLYADLVQQANSLREQVAEDADGVMTLSFPTTASSAAFAAQSYQEVAALHPVLGGYTPRPKPVLLSRGMSWLNISGIYIPFTFEANVNVDAPDYSIPSSMLHELAHSKGFMREDEANFIAYITGVNSGNADFAYSSTMLGLIHTGNALYSSDREAYYETASGLSAGVRRDLEANSAYWRQFEGPVAEVSTAMNNTYLRSNNQPNGVKSYGHMVDLLLAQYRQDHGIA